MVKEHVKGKLKKKILNTYGTNTIIVIKNINEITMEPD